MNHPSSIKHQGQVYIIDRRATAQLQKRHAAEQTEMEGTEEGYLTWPVYQSEAQQEREQVENVYGLGGGELDDSGDNFGGYAFWYEGAPEYADEARDYDNEYRTVLMLGGGFLPNPEKTLEADGQTWTFAANYMNSGESDCWVCGSGGNGKEWWAEEFEKEHGEAPRPDDQCGLCETEFNDMPGMVYIGDGYEAVYKLVEEDEAEEDDYED